MTNQYVTVSIVIPCYNHGQYIQEALDSIDVQKINYDIEVIIVDDGSTDRTTQIGLSYSEKFGCDKVRVLTLSSNRGKGGAVRLVIIFPALFIKYIHNAPIKCNHTYCVQ